MLRIITLSTILITLMGLLVYGFYDTLTPTAPLPPVAQYYADNVVADTGAVNVVAAINFDYRAYDTIGEATILLTAVTGVTVLLRSYQQRRRATGEA